MGKVIQMFPLPAILEGRISQATYDVMSPELRSETERMANEFEKGMTKYAPAAARAAELAEYFELAQRSGTTLKAALTRYVNLENAMRADPVEGICLVLKNMGISPASWARDYLSRKQIHADCGSNSSEIPRP
jgi:hypothetical protein